MGQSRRVEADIVAHIAEVEERRLYARKALPSMFAYCTDVLHLSEAEAYLRISAARTFRRWCASCPRDGPYPRPAFSSFRTAETVRSLNSVQTELPHLRPGRGRTMLLPCR